MTPQSNDRSSPASANNLPPTPPPDISLSDSTLRALTKLSQHSPTEVNFLKALWDETASVLEQETSFFLEVPMSHCDPAPKTKTAILQDTGALLAMPENLARLVLYQVEGRFHKLVRKDLSDEQWAKVQILGNRLAQQHPDHVTNVIRLWRKVMDMKGEGVHEVMVKDLGPLWQHQDAEAVVLVNRLDVRMDGEVLEDKKVVVPKIEEGEDC